MISKIRKALGLSQLQMAESLGISRSQMAMIEAGKRELPVNEFIGLVKVHELLFSGNSAVNKQGGSSIQLPPDQLSLRRQLMEDELFNAKHRLSQINTRIAAARQQNDRSGRLSAGINGLAGAVGPAMRKLLELRELEMKVAARKKGVASILKLEIQQRSVEAIIAFLEDEMKKG